VKTLGETWLPPDNRKMHSLFSCLLVLRGKTYPFVVFFLLLAVLLYQLVSGRLFNLSWGVWLTRNERPRAFWTVIIIEAAVVLTGLYLGTL